MSDNSWRADEAQEGMWAKLSAWGIALVMALTLSVVGAQAQMAYADDTEGADFEESLQPGQWVHSSGGWWFEYDDGTYATGLTFIMENEDGGMFYYFDNSGWMRTGWQYVDDDWYYFEPSGRMAWEWQQVNGKWYFLNPEMLTGWQLMVIDDGDWFSIDPEYLDAWLEQDGCTHHAWYLLDSSGAMLTGWQNVGGTWYYLDGSGAMATGWQYLGGKWYYLNPESGAMATGWVDVDGIWYLMNGSGAMLTGWQNVGGTWYYLYGSGAMATGWQYLSGSWYYLQPSGAMATGWADVDGTWYYMNGSGVMQANKWIGDYYLLGSGAMATDQWVGQYYVGDDGRWIPDATANSSSVTNSSTVYWTAGGSVYHATDNCVSLKNSKNVKSGTIAQSGKSRGCNLCVNNH